MSDTTNPEEDNTAATNHPTPYPPATTDGGLAPVPGAPPATVAPLGQVRETGTCVLLTIVTLGFYTWYWFYKTHDEMKQHSGTGIGGGVAR